MGGRRGVNMDRDRQIIIIISFIQTTMLQLNESCRHTAVKY